MRNILIYIQKPAFKEELSGSVSVFFALILLVLITFLFSIFDYTRLQYIQLEATSNLNTAAELALSQYDPFLLQQYGLFAGDEGAAINDILNTCLQTQFYPDEAMSKAYLLDYLLDDNPKNQVLNLLEPLEYQYNLSYIPFLDSTYSNPKKQILDYMKLREPYLFLKPFLTHLELFSKSTKTSSVIQEKNDIVMGLDALEAYKIDLYYLIDGIRLYNDGAFEIDQDSSYIRKFSYENQVNYDFFPESLKQLFKANVIFYDVLFASFEEDIQSIDNLINGLMYSDPYEYVNLEAPDGQIITVGTIEKESTREAFEILEMLKDNILQYQQDYQFFDELLETHLKALEAIQAFEAICIDNLEAINLYQSRLEETDGLIESVVLQMDQELETIKGELSGSSLSLKDNIGLMKEQILGNIAILSQNQSSIESLKESLNDYIVKRYNNRRDKARISEEFLELLDIRFKGLLTNSKNATKSITKSEVLDSYISIEDALKNYKTDCIFDYRKLTSLKPENNIYEEKEETLKKLDILSVFKEKNILGLYPELQLDERLLPSRLFEPVSQTASTTNTARAASDNSSFSFNDLSSVLDIIESGKDRFLINEYAIGMFGNVAKQGNPNGKTLNHFQIKEHLLDYETEYIIGGSMDEEENLQVVMNYLYGVRFTLNLIHLTMDAEKRTIIMNIASTIAGWWTGGVGAILIAAIIGAAWALLESVADVFLLVSGERVPLLKTSSTWYTSLDGNLMELFDGVVRRMDNEMVILIESSKALIKDKMGDLNKIIDEYRDSSLETSFAIFDQVKGDFENQLNQLAMDVGIQIDLFNDTVDDQIITYLDQCFNKALVEGPQELELPDPIGESEEIINLALKMGKEGLYQFSQLDRSNQTITNAILIKEKLLQDYKTSIQDIKYSYQKELNQIFERNLDFQMEGLNIVISQMLKSQMKIGKEILYEKADTLKKDIFDEIKKNEGSSKSSFSFIPSFSYEDYLRLYLILPIVDDETLMARIMDLIQMNAQKNANDYTKGLASYFVGIQVEASVTAKTLFVPNIKNGQVSKQWELEVNPVEKKYE